MARRRPKKAYPAALIQEGQHFASGVNHPGEARGLALTGRHFGITFGEIRDGLLEELANYAGPGSMQRLFVDSQAFSEVKWSQEERKLVVVKPISHEGWLQRFELYRWAAAAYGRRAYLVAPDRVGCQATTLERLERYAAEMQVCARARANIIVPVQKGEFPMSAMFRRASEILGVRDLIAGVPMKKDATSLEDLAELVDSLPRSRPTDDRVGARIHLLGLGPESPRFAAVIALIKKLRPHAVITSDSVTIRRLVGRTNGRGGGPRALTRYQDEARGAGFSAPAAVKEYALGRQGRDEYEAELDRAHGAGWYDEELYDSMDEAVAHRAAGYPEPADHAGDTDRDPIQEDTVQQQRPPAIRAFLGDEVIADNFAGGGGASSGIEIALGRSPDIAVNHDEEAIAMHKANHPTTRHYQESVWEVDPVEACEGKPVALAWFSPDCKHFSKSKGGQPRNQKIRGLAWSAVRWAAAVKPRVIALENVEEFRDWGPLHRKHSPGCSEITEHAPDCEPIDGECSAKGCGFGACRKAGCQINRPIKSRKGETFRAFVSKLEKLGYNVEWRLLRACDYGAPTSRRRLFLVARCDGRTISWPVPTHGPGTGQPYRAAAEVIDWSLPCPSIFDRDKPLADKTLARIARGIRKFVLNNARPFIIPVNHGGYDAAGEPRRDLRVHDIADPLPTITAQRRGAHALISPTLVRTAHGERDRNGKKRGRGEHSVEEPLPTVCASSVDYAIAVPYLVHRSNGERQGQAPRIYDIERPLGTIVAQGQKHALVAAFLAKHYGERSTGGWNGGKQIDLPIDTVTTKDHHSLVAAHLVRYNGERRDGEARGAQLEVPLPTQDTSNRFGLVATHLMKFQGTSDAHIEASSSSMDDPAPTITAQGGKLAQVSAFLVRYNGTGDAESAQLPLGTLTTHDRYGLVTVMIGGEEYAIVDIGMRMLTPRELFRAQSFADDYEIEPAGPGGKPLSRTAQVRMCGNSVPPVLAAAVISALEIEDSPAPELEPEVRAA